MVTVEVKQTVSLDIGVAAKWFAHMSDDEQARFFVAVAEEAGKTWGKDSSPDAQWDYIGLHLAGCKCSTEGAQNMIRKIAAAMEHGIAEDHKDAA